MSAISSQRSVEDHRTEDNQGSMYDQNTNPTDGLQRINASSVHYQKEDKFYALLIKMQEQAEAKEEARLEERREDQERLRMQFLKQEEDYNNFKREMIERRSSKVSSRNGSPTASIKDSKEIIPISPIKQEEDKPNSDDLIIDLMLDKVKEEEELKSIIKSSQDARLIPHVSAFSSLSHTETTKICPLEDVKYGFEPTTYGTETQLGRNFKISDEPVKRNPSVMYGNPRYHKNTDVNWDQNETSNSLHPNFTKRSSSNTEKFQTTIAENFNDDKKMANVQLLNWGRTEELPLRPRIISSQVNRVDTNLVIGNTPKVISETATLLATLPKIVEKNNESQMNKMEKVMLNAMVLADTKRTMDHRSRRQSFVSTRDQMMIQKRMI